MNKKVLRNLSYGVYAVSALGENRMSGCIANSIMQITSSPATLAVSMNHDNYTHECIEKSGMFAVSILSEKTDPNIISQLGFQSSRLPEILIAGRKSLISPRPNVRSALFSLLHRSACRPVVRPDSSRRRNRSFPRG